MCRSKIEGGRRCPGKRARTTTQPATTVDITTTTTSTVTISGTSSGTPKLTALLTANRATWYETPWSQRKTVIAEAIQEYLTHTNSPADWGGWDRSKRALGRTHHTLNRARQTVEVKVTLSDPLLRTAEPATVVDTIVHETAHSLLPAFAGHGPIWEKKFSELRASSGVDGQLSSTHTSTEAERLERQRQHTSQALVGDCPQNHTFYRGRKPKYEMVCRACANKKLPATITWRKNLRGVTK